MTEPIWISTEHPPTFNPTTGEDATEPADIEDQADQAVEAAPLPADTPVTEPDTAGLTADEATPLIEKEIG